ncbi:32 kDa beta-galactoside-binding lectin-like [Dendropsophus ebraccatus]|uniref:32 kDa beta-galactoside-binding lectin-like n=1 Tax=Dendropsophus ebraccatus TaxID=150705 RepID=UPI003831E2E5
MVPALLTTAPVPVEQIPGISERTRMPGGRGREFSPAEGPRDCHDDRPGPHHGTSDQEAAMHRYKPKGPYQALLGANFKRYGHFTVIGDIPEKATRFGINYIDTQTGDVHFNSIIRFVEGETEPTLKNNETVIPFQPGKEFTVVIAYISKRFVVYANGKEVVSYDYTRDINKIDLIEIQGENKLKCIHL